MAGWLLGAAVASIVTVGTFAALMFVSTDVRRLHDEPQSTSALAYSLNSVRPPMLWPLWVVTRANSAHHALIVEIEARHVEDARHIAEQIVNPVRNRGYQEILIYVFPVGNPDGAMRRIQWTPGRGYVEMAYKALD